MAQFDVYLLRDTTYVVDVQSPLASVHATRLVIPLIAPDADASPTSRLNPLLTLDGQQWVLATHFASTVDASTLKAPVASLAHEEWAIKGAIDFLTGGF
ncbi:CcdB family protein [Sphingomonadaceae bacterium OTU29MARTA1]|uniref:CcdB family protein n=1 Tax=Sphingomonas sp. Leaf37 TaxID=2876552 RepID=UPI001E2EEAFD|nr:CcdB family protein [Sphingomonas sp. Leaf37]USU03727.1 CcdB family protein [Sphingomonadaceae bacterium OTU29LAMAA1]USU07478.1 CcdB family protein [Sphingomonadaceae bacterium OTU29MARTA1]USU10970.1 CcdB family protein [Sphingomonadaceae bacterium OTU29THOMA1]